MAKNWTIKEVVSEIEDRITHFYFQTDGTYRFPNNAEGDMLKMLHNAVEREKHESPAPAKE